MVRKIALVVLFWVGAALAAALANRVVQPLSQPLAVVVEVLVIAAAGFGYTRLAGCVSVAQALLVGSVWAMLGMFTEMAVTANSGRGWFVLLGAPTTPVLHVITVLAWIGAAALFARRQVAR